MFAAEAAPGIFIYIEVRVGAASAANNRLCTGLQPG